MAARSAQMGGQGLCRGRVWAGRKHTSARAGHARFGARLNKRIAQLRDRKSVVEGKSVVGDWSSDVCSSDLAASGLGANTQAPEPVMRGLAPA